MVWIKSVLPFGLVVFTIQAAITNGFRGEDLVAMAVLCMITLFLYTPYFWFRRKSSRHGRLHFTLTLLALLCTTALAFIAESPVLEVWLGLAFFSWLTLTALALISNIIAVPLYILPTRPPLLTSRNETLASSDETAAIVDIESTITVLRTQFDEFYRAISQERTGLQKTFSQMQQEFESQTDAIAQAKGELEEARKKAEHYRRIADLSKDDQRVFLDLIARNKRQDYWIGLGTGIVSSGFGAVVIWLLGTLFS